jgi:hypothetical protein
MPFHWTAVGVCGDLMPFVKPTAMHILLEGHETPQSSPGQASSCPAQTSPFQRSTNSEREAPVATQNLGDAQLTLKRLANGDVRLCQMRPFHMTMRPCATYPEEVRTCRVPTATQKLVDGHATESRLPVRGRSALGTGFQRDVVTAARNGPEVSPPTTKHRESLAQVTPDTCSPLGRFVGVASAHRCPSQD